MNPAKFGLEMRPVEHDTYITSYEEMKAITLSPQSFSRGVKMENIINSQRVSKGWLGFGINHILMRLSI